MTLIATAVVRSRKTVSATIRSRLIVSASIRSNQPIAVVCPEITSIDGGFPDSIYTPVYGLINGGAP
jgi:hypothetical protein